MLRYVAIATVIVLAIAVLATAWVGRELIRIKIASVAVRAQAKPAPPNGPLAANSRPFIGDAPWALSALPECLLQREESRGTVAYVRSHLPADAKRIHAPATLHYADCTIRLVGNQAKIQRGRDRFRIPPIARFYLIGNRLALLRIVAKRAELRIYQNSSLKM